MSRKHELLSAYLDGELNAEDARSLEEGLREDPRLQEKFNQYKGLEERLHGVPEPDYAASSEAIFEELEERISRRRERALPVWQRRVALPMPLVAAASLLFVSMAALSLFLLARPSASQPTPLAGMEPRDLDITIQIDDAQAQELIRWLEERNDVQQVNIQLPDTPKFELIGEPVLMPASDARGQSR